MKKLFLFLVAAGLLVFFSCEKLNTEVTENRGASLKSGNVVMNFRAHLSGDEEVPAVETNATGQAIFQLSKDGSELSYKVIVAHIDDVLQSHIHIGQAGTNGGVVAFLYPSEPPAILIPGTSNGILAQGVITAASLRGSLDGQELSALVDALSTGNAYVNVHTIAHPTGEIRGQVK